MTETETAAEAACILRQHIADSRGRERITVTAARLTTVLDAVENSGHTAPAPQADPLLVDILPEGAETGQDRLLYRQARKNETAFVHDRDTFKLDIFANLQVLASDLADGQFGNFDGCVQILEVLAFDVVDLAIVGHQTEEIAGHRKLLPVLQLPNAQRQAEFRKEPNPAPAPQPRALPTAAEIDDMIERLLDAQQDINLSANETMSQPLCDASALIDEVETMMRRFLAARQALKGEHA